MTLYTTAGDLHSIHLFSPLQTTSYPLVPSSPYNAEVMPFLQQSQYDETMGEN